MSWEVNDQEFEAVLHQTPEKQYDYFVGHCADQAEVWGLVQDETDRAAVEDDDGNRFFAVWPHPRYAEACRQRDWGSREPAPIEVHEFVDVVIPRLIADEMGVAVFPLPDRRHIPVPPLSAPERSRSRADAHRVILGRPFRTTGILPR